MGGGGFSMEPENPALDEYVLSLTGVARPRVCFVPTASGDAEGYVQRFLAAFEKLDCRPSSLSLFRRDDRDLRAFVLEQHVIYVGGGNTANLLVVWRRHGLDVILREAWQQGVVLCGVSAGSLCWFEDGVTDSFGPLAALGDGLGFLPGSHCPHYDGEAHRRPTYQRLVASGTLSAGWACDDGAAIRWAGTAFAEAVSSRPAAKVYRVERDMDEVVERGLVPIRL
jgi:peptidase E